MTRTLSCEISARSDKLYILIGSCSMSPFCVVVVSNLLVDLAKPYDSELNWILEWNSEFRWSQHGADTSSMVSSTKSVDCSNTCEASRQIHRRKASRGKYDTNDGPIAEVVNVLYTFRHFPCLLWSDTMTGFIKVFRGSCDPFLLILHRRLTRDWFRNL